MSDAAPVVAKPDSPSETSTPKRRLQTFQALRYRTFRFLWISLIVSSVGTWMQTCVPPQMRGRVMSLNTLFIMGVRPLGDFPAGALIGLVGGPLTVLISAGIVGGYTLVLLFTRPVIRSL